MSAVLTKLSVLVTTKITSSQASPYLIPGKLALFYLAEGDPKQTIVYGANFGRDADTIASMAGALAGAYSGVDALPVEWITKVSEESPRNHEAVVQRLVQVVQQRLQDSEGRNEVLRGMMG